MLRDVLSRCLLFSRIVMGCAVVGALVADCTLSAIGTARAQAAFPTKPIRVVVGFAAGGPSDIVARVVGAAMSKTLGEQLYVENRAGASGNLATELVARSEPDGYTLLLSTLTHPVNEILFKNFKYKQSEHFASVALLVETGLVLLVHPSLNVNSVADLVSAAKAKPGEVLYATAGRATATHLAAELFNSAAGTKMTAVHYKGGGETVKDLLSGQVKVMFSTIPPVLGFVKGGQLRGLATSGLKRDDVLSELKTITESGLPGYDVLLWSGLSAPKGTPRPVIDKLAAAAKKALEEPDTQNALAAQGYTSKFLDPDEFAKFYQSEVVKWAKVADAIGTLGE
jgi:tripartite-type tricarboxylate transporter receptor subunit TctC